MAEAKQQKEKGTLLQLILFIALSTIAAGVQWVIAYFGEDLLLKVSDSLAKQILIDAYVTDVIEQISDETVQEWFKGLISG